MPRPTAKASAATVTALMILFFKAIFAACSGGHYVGLRPVQSPRFYPDREYHYQNKKRDNQSVVYECNHAAASLLSLYFKTASIVCQRWSLCRWYRNANNV